jgi:hypothetical protein
MHTPPTPPTPSLPTTPPTEPSPAESSPSTAATPAATDSSPTTPASSVGTVHGATPAATAPAAAPAPAAPTPAPAPPFARSATPAPRTIRSAAPPKATVVRPAPLFRPAPAPTQIIIKTQPSFPWFFVLVLLCAAGAGAYAYFNGKADALLESVGIESPKSDTPKFSLPKISSSPAAPAKRQTIFGTSQDGPSSRPPPPPPPPPEPPEPSVSATNSSTAFHNSKIAAIIAAQGVSWRGEDNSILTFSPDGTFVETWGYFSRRTDTWKSDEKNEISLQDSSDTYTLSTEGNTLLRENINRLYQKFVNGVRQSDTTPTATPAPAHNSPNSHLSHNSQIAAIIAAPGVSWHRGTSTFTFSPDGVFVETWPDGRGSGTWKLQDKNSILTEHPDNAYLRIVFTLSADGTSIKRNNENENYQKFVSASTSPKTLSRAEIVGLIAIPGVRWRSPISNSTFTFSHDGTFVETWDGGRPSGTWKLYEKNSISVQTNDWGSPNILILSLGANSMRRYFHGISSVYQKFVNGVLQPDITPTALSTPAAAPAPLPAPQVGHAHTQGWSATQPPATATTLPSQSPAGAKLSPPPAAPASVSAPAPKTLSPVEEFDILKKTEEALFAKEMAIVNRRDKSSLETLQKRIGISDVKLYQQIEAAISAVNNGESFYAEAPSQKRRLSSHAIEFWRIKQERDKRIAETIKNVANRFKSSYQATQRRALAAKDFETAKQAEIAAAAAVTGKYSIVGRWREMQGQRKIVLIKSNGTVWHEDVNKGGSWHEISPRIFSIGKDNDWGAYAHWAGRKWRLSADGKTLRRTDIEMAISRE